MDTVIKNYLPCENSNPKIPKNYRLCEQLGNKARIALGGLAVICSAECPYLNRSKCSITYENCEHNSEKGCWETEYFCMTKGLVKKEEK